MMPRVKLQVKYVQTEAALTYSRKRVDTHESLLLTSQTFLLVEKYLQSANMFMKSEKKHG